MLGFFRRMINSKVGVIVTFAVLGVIALAFAAGDVTGLASTGSGGMSSQSVASVGKSAIGVAEFRKRVQDEVQAIRQQNPQIDMAQFIAQGGLDGTLQRLVTGLAFQKFAGDEGMAVSKRLADGQLASIPALQGPTGKFDQAMYERILAQRGLTDKAIRADLVRDLLGQQLLMPTIGAGQVPAGLALPYASLLLEKRQGEVAMIPTRAVAAGPAPTDAELQQYYQRNAQRYTIPERRVIRIARVSADQVKAQAQPTDAEIAAAYRQQAATFAPSEKRTITQATVLTQAAADQLAAKVKGGASLADAARAAGLEARTVSGVQKPAYAQQAGAAVADAAFGAARGAVIGPVRGSIGYVVARVDAVEAVPGKSLAQARPELVAALEKTKTQEALARIHDALDDAIADNASFNELVADQKLTATTTPALTAAGVDPTQPAAKPDPALAPAVTAAYGMEEGDSPQLVPTAQDGSFALVGLDRVVRASPRPLADVRAAVASDFTADRARRAARQIAVTVNQKINRGVPLAQALRETGLTLPAPEKVDAARAQLASNPRGAPPALVLLFAMAQGSGKMLEAEGGAGWYVVKLDRIQPGDARNTPAIINVTRTDLGRAIGREYAEQFATAVRNGVGVKRNEAAITSVRRELLGQGEQN